MVLLALPSRSHRQTPGELPAPRGTRLVQLPMLADVLRLQLHGFLLAANVPAHGDEREVWDPG